MLIVQIAAGVVIGGVTLFVMYLLFLNWLEQQQWNSEARLRQLKDEQNKRDLDAAKTALGGDGNAFTWPPKLDTDPTGKQRFKPQE